MTPADLVARVAPSGSVAASAHLPDMHERLGTLVSRHFAKADTVKVLGAGAAIGVGLFLLLYGAIGSVVAGDVEPGLWLGPVLVVGGLVVLAYERREARQALGVYERGFLYVDGARPFALLWSEVAHVEAVTEDGTMTMSVTTTGGRVHAISDRVQGLTAIVTIFQNRG